MILKKGCFSDLKIIEIRDQVIQGKYDQQDLPQKYETQNIENVNLTEIRVTAPMFTQDKRNN